MEQVVAQAFKQLLQWKRLTTKFRHQLSIGLIWHYRHSRSFLSHFWARSPIELKLIVFSKRNPHYIHESVTDRNCHQKAANPRCPNSPKFVSNKAKGRISIGCSKKTKHAKFSEKRTFLTPWYAHVRARIRRKEMFVFRKIGRALFSWNTREIRPFALSPTSCHFSVRTHHMDMLKPNWGF